jgi:hypothetical protein
VQDRLPAVDHHGQARHEIRANPQVSGGIEIGTVCGGDTTCP